ncbi:Rab GDP dissociation inhibitor alpha [Dipsacomyces acuminosporus]|nr:Rab GDP dissociation inhibitor alpha [Dipsacomyces acuminosporus]
MDEEYDVVILGTGLTECVLSGILSVEGKKVLHIDRNDYYGGECASLNLTQLYAKFRNSAEPPSKLGRDRDYNIDLIPKFLMADEGLVKVLVYTDVTRYLEFKAINSSLVYRDGKINKVPTTATEALASPLMGFFQKRKAKSFFEFLQKWRDDDPSTHQGGLNLDKNTMKEVYEYFGLDNGTQDFIGHAMALYLDDSYKNRAARETYSRIVLYTKSVGRYGPSPYIYPGYGLGELPQSFSRLSAVYGGTYMLDHPVDEIVREDGKFAGVRSGEQVVKAKQVIGDPSYFTDNVKKTGRVIRAIAILNHPIPNTDNDPKNEIVSALQLLGDIEEIFVSTSDLFEPLEDGTKDNVFISRSYDATSHFETVNDDIRDLYRRITGKDLELKKRPSAEEEQAAALANASAGAA